MILLLGSEEGNWQVYLLPAITEKNFEKYDPLKNDPYNVLEQELESFRPHQGNMVFPVNTYDEIYAVEVLLRPILPNLRWRKLQGREILNYLRDKITNKQRKFL